MIIGGQTHVGLNATSSAFIFDPDTKTFDYSLPSLTIPRLGLACVVFNSVMHNRREVVLAVGGGDDYDIPTAEVYDYTQTNAVWTQSNYCFLLPCISYCMLEKKTLIQFYYLIFSS